MYLEYTKKALNHNFLLNSKEISRVFFVADELHSLGIIEGSLNDSSLVDLFLWIRQPN